MGETNEYRFRGSTSFSYRESTLSGSQGGLNTGRETCIYFRLGTSALGLKISKNIFSMAIKNLRVSEKTSSFRKVTKCITTIKNTNQKQLTP